MRGESAEAGKRGCGEAGGLPAWQKFAAVLRRVAGMPDYDAHIEHLRRCHPDQPVPTERQFYDEFTRARYGDGPTRCC
ncbi:MAG: YbdD/YjiX family protein [Gemmatimonadales bacterium]